VNGGWAAGALAGLVVGALVLPGGLAAQTSGGPQPPLAVGHAAAGSAVPGEPDNPVPPPGAAAPIAVGQAMRGVLEPGDRLMEDSTLADVWLLDGFAGETVTIDLRSQEFDTYLEVLDAAGTILGRDDDSGGDLNSRLTLTLPATGTYQIVVNSAGHERRAGRYVVSVR